MDHRRQPWRALERGDFVRLAYRLGRARANGVCEVAPDVGTGETLFLHKGQLLSDPTGTAPSLRLAALCSGGGRYRFEGHATHEPQAGQRATCLASFARRHLETQLDSHSAARLVGELAGIRLSVRGDLLPPARVLDDVDRRILSAMNPPRRLDQIWPLARTPRFRLLAFLHFLRGVGALECEGVAASRVANINPEKQAAQRLLGVRPDDDFDVVKRAYRQLVRAVHPDLQPTANTVRRRYLEKRLADINRAYEILS